MPLTPKARKATPPRAPSPKAASPPLRATPGAVPSLDTPKSAPKKGSRGKKKKGAPNYELPPHARELREDLPLSSSRGDRFRATGSTGNRRPAKGSKLAPLSEDDDESPPPRAGGGAGGGGDGAGAGAARDERDPRQPSAAHATGSRGASDDADEAADERLEEWVAIDSGGFMRVR